MRLLNSMGWLTIFSLVALVSVASAQSPLSATGKDRIVDLTHAFDSNTIYWPTETGFSRRWSKRESYLGMNETGPAAVADLHFPGLAPVAARWLVEHRAIKAIGIDTASIDHGQSQRFQSHVTLCEHNVPVFENVANLDELRGKGATVIALPMKIAGGSAAPLRIIAIIQ